MLTEFQNQDGRDVHHEFQAWRRHHPNGFFLTFRSKENARLHATMCPHSDDVQWTVTETNQSLTTRRKVCAVSREVLLAWAAGVGVRVVYCADCVRGVPLKTESGSDPNALTAFSWGYWGWGNSVPQFLQAATSHESARGFKAPTFADIRYNHNGRAAGFKGKALEGLVGAARCRSFKGLGNVYVGTGEAGIKIHNPAEVHALLNFVKAQADDGRRVLFFCACPVKRLRRCHRTTVATLLLRAAHVQHVDLTVVEWPGGDPESRELRVTTAQEKRTRGKTIPLGERMPSDGLATLPWGSIVTVRSGELTRAVLTGPAVFADEWRLPQFGVSDGDAPHKAALEAQARKLRTRWGCDARH